eukprot:13876522-Alexandrium_andersonii.AAC.1
MPPITGAQVLAASRRFPARTATSADCWHPRGVQHWGREGCEAAAAVLNRMEALGRAPDLL